MRSLLAVAVIAITSFTSAQPLFGVLPLDIGGLLSSLGPAPATDSRFTNFQPAGPGDGKPDAADSMVLKTGWLTCYP